jgi:maltooligosyltrehalose trehalohydrolase
MKSSATLVSTDIPDSLAAEDTIYQVWAPHARELVLELNGSRFPMQRDVRGWWSSTERREHGARYGFLVDGAGPYPDPRSPFQPDGVHGRSAHVEHTKFRWTDERWQAPPLASAVIYELHVGTFSDSGTFAGAIPHLAELADLGITHVELMPVAEFSGSRGWGYDGVDLFAPHHTYGTPDDLKRFVDACHAHGLAVLLDVVYNHFGPCGNYLGKFGPYTTSRYVTPWGGAVNLDGPGSDEVRRFLCDNACMWLRDYHIDGLRLDAVHAMIDMSATHLLEQLVTEVEQLGAMLGRHLVLVAESDLNDPRVTRSREAGGYGIHAQWSDDFHHALHAVLTGERSGYYEDFGALPQLAAAMTHGFVFAGQYSPHRQRAHGRKGEEPDGWKFVVAAQNHDQVGNRARGDRLSHLVSPAELKIAAALLLCSPYVPMLFQGEEWGAGTPFCYFTAHEEPDLARQVCEGRRREFAAFGWRAEQIPDPQSVDTFAQSRLNRAERMADGHAELLDWHRRLIALRRALPELRSGNLRQVRVKADDEGRWLVVHRGPIVIACNLSTRVLTLPLGDIVQVHLASDTGLTISAHEVRLAPRSVAVLRQRRQSFDMDSR